MNTDSEFDKLIATLADCYPYVLIDRVLECDLEQMRIKTLKCISHTESFLVGHFPDQPTLPGVLMLMAFVQAASVLYRRPMGVPLSIQRVRFQNRVYPGDMLLVKVEQMDRTNGTIHLQCLGQVDQTLCVKGRIAISDVA